MAREFRNLPRPLTWIIIVLQISAFSLNFPVLLCPNLAAKKTCSFIHIYTSPELHLTDPTPRIQWPGPEVFIGPLGSCSRLNQSGPINCTKANLDYATIDLSVLQPNESSSMEGMVPQYLITRPYGFPQVFLVVSMVLMVLFMFLHVSMLYPNGLFALRMHEFRMRVLVVFEGLVTEVFLIASTLTFKWLYKKDTHDFNEAIRLVHTDVNLKAEEGQSFTYAAVSISIFGLALFTHFVFYASAALHSDGGGAGVTGEEGDESGKEGAAVIVVKS